MQKFSMNRLFACLLVFARVITADGTTSSEAVNPFNEFMAAEGGVDLLSGEVAFPHTLYTLKSANGMTLPIKLKYSSNIKLNVKARNDIAPTTWVGLGWALGFGSIKCDHKGTRDKGDDTYVRITGEGVAERIFVRFEIGLNKTPKYYLERNPFHKVLPYDGNNDGIIDGWEITDENGIKYSYGNCAGVSEASKTVRYTFSWPAKNYVGVGYSGTPEKFPYQWDVSSIKDPYGNGFHFEYSQDCDPNGYSQYDAQEALTVKNWTSPFKYTKASYLKKILSTTGEHAIFKCRKKEKGEYRDPRTAKPEPDGFIEFFETLLLEKIEIRNTKQALIRSYNFCYNRINTLLFERENIKVQAGTTTDYNSLSDADKCFTKSLLTSIAEKGVSEKEYSKVIFSYFDGSDYQKSIENALEKKSDYYFGAIKSVRLPECGEIEFTYYKKEMAMQALFHADFKYAENIAWGRLNNGREYAVVNRGDNFFELYLWVGSKWVKGNQPRMRNSYGDEFTTTNVVPGDNSFFRIGKFTDSYTSEGFSGCKGNLLHAECVYLPEQTVFTDVDYLDIDAYYWNEKIEQFEAADVLSKNCLNGTCNDHIRRHYFKRNSPYSVFGNELWAVHEPNDDGSNKKNKLLICGLKDAKNSSGFSNKTMEWEIKEFNWHEDDLTVTANQVPLKKIKFGKRFFVHYDDESPTGRTVLFVYSLDNTGAVKGEKFEFDDKVYRVDVTEDYVLVHTKGVFYSWLYTIRFDGTNWKFVNWQADDEKHRCKDCDAIRTSVGKDFFAIYQNEPGNLTSYFWNGEDWVNIVNNKSYDLPRWSIKRGEVQAGNDFFVFNYPEKIEGHCDDLRTKERFKVFQWDGGPSWNVNALNTKLELGNKRRKGFAVGKDFFAGIRTKNSRDARYHPK